jgi:hypothetical protein
MKSCLKRVTLGLAAGAALALVGFAPSARAALVIQYSTTGTPGSFTTIATGPNSGATFGNPPFFNTPAAIGATGFSAHIIAGASDSPGSAISANLTDTELLLQNNNSTQQTIYLALGATDFTSPATPPSVLVSSGIGGNGASGTTGTVTITSFIDQNNGQNTLAPGAGVTVVGPATPVAITATSFSTGSTGLIASLGPTFSITELVKVTLSAHGSVSLGSFTSLSQTAPEPSTMALAGLGALGLIGYGVRRRKVLGN